MSDRVAWSEMFDSYRQTAGYSPDASINEVVWSWIHADLALQAIVVEDDEGLLGFAHYRRFPRPILGDAGIYLDDLFTRPEARGRGVARMMLSHLAAQLETGAFSVLRWTTKPGNDPARRLYEQFGALSESITYNANPHSGEATPS
nr:MULTISPECIES: GNAT family N-acetyltransferase [unclassified Pseudoclavibacter]